MRLLHVLFALLCVAAGVLFGALNPSPVTLDFWFATIESTLGVALLFALLIGALLGGLAVTAGVVWPLRRRLKLASRSSGATEPAAGDTPIPDVTHVS